ncbi:gamma-glutamyl phosphate reductase [Rhizocola hellebori]|uniref:Gamma-glutamyl phosphate reductase n=1 Tax=Rhizocola hellebori TaxID=1392758 RepID=A0A8J3QIW1_9ACTN|nr:glutamate-5-semialdehyde dehydrogenase [Rhizocola hellebori]GIH10462.1 gamma-glutamyl phosphate reductase [Rhizocola hellebori]
MSIYEKARAASITLASALRTQKDAALLAMASALESSAAAIIEANAADVEVARKSGTPESTVDRLLLTQARIGGMAQGLRDIAGLPDPVGEVVRGGTLANGLQVRQIRVPFGVVGIIYEARPNVTADAAGLTLKSGNAVLLRGSGSAARSNAAIVAALRSALAATGLPADAVQLVDSSTRDSVKELMRARGQVDVLIPRGGASLIRTVVEESSVPVIETGVGNCHIYVDESADLDMALRILLNAKVQRPSVCNAAESLLVHAAVADEFLPAAMKALADNGVTVNTNEEDFGTEFLSLEISLKIVDSLDDAIAHIRRYGSGHSEAIITSSVRAAARFTDAIDAAAVLVNASTRFVDGGELGFGAEIGISTQKLHARGPMGLPELTSTKYVITGDGHIRA